jgi:hypothetical protein
MSTLFERNLFFAVTGKYPPSRKRKPRREIPARDEVYKAWIRSLRCCACGRSRGIEAAHVGKDGGRGVKCSDYATVPLCHICHRTGPHSYHGLNGGARSFQAMWCIDFRALVEKYNAIYAALNGIDAGVIARARGRV